MDIIKNVPNGIVKSEIKQILVCTKVLKTGFCIAVTEIFEQLVENGAQRIQKFKSVFFLSHKRFQWNGAQCNCSIRVTDIDLLLSINHLTEHLQDLLWTEGPKFFYSLKAYSISSIDRTYFKCLLWTQTFINVFFAPKKLNI